MARLLHHCGQGSREAFADLYDATGCWIHGLVVRMLGSGPQADEVAEQVFVEIWRTCRRCDRGKPLTWMLTIAYRHARQARARSTAGPTV